MSSPTLSAVNSAVEEGSLMSRASDAASELGRRLRIDGRESRDAMARTRGMAKREEERQITSRAPATRSGGQSTRQAAKPTPGSSKTPARGARQQAQESSDEDSDDDDDDDDDAAADDGDDQDGDGEHDPRSGALGPREKVLQILSAFEPNYYTYEEMRRTTTPVRQQSSIAYRNLAHQMAGLLANSNQAVQSLERSLPVEGSVWSQQTVSNMTSRSYRIFQDLAAYERNARGGGDVIDTVGEICSFFTAVEGILHRFRNMSNGSHQSLISLLQYVLAQIIVNWDRDLRGSGSSGRPAYAGGSDQHEHNLYLRFTSTQRDWMRCLEVLRRLGSVYGQYFRADGQRWAQIIQELKQRYANGQWPNRSVVEFAAALRDRLEGMQVQLT